MLKQQHSSSKKILLCKAISRVKLSEKYAANMAEALSADLDYDQIVKLDKKRDC